MCGILNIINKNGQDLNIDACKIALLKLKNRGPDLSFSYSPSPNIFLGQTVLSLVGDTTDVETNYLWSPSKRFYISFNGEIYNYKELSNRFLNNNLINNTVTTDTEVLVSLHDRQEKKEVPSHLDGMFAYTIYDNLENEIFLTRDIQGEKSLFIYEDRELIIISSQIDAIQEYIGELELNIDVFKDYFYTRHFLQQESTSFKNIRQLKTGCLEVLNLKKMEFRTIQRLSVCELVSESKSNELEKRSIDDLADELDSILRSCVKEMVPHDRKFSSVLSGGIDSSLLSAYACELGHPEALIAVNHSGKDLISMDLSGFEKAINQKVDIINVTKESYANEISNSILTLSSPLLSHSFIGQNIQSAYVKEKGCKALFGGEGADELFGGYDCYLQPNLESDTCPSPYSGLFVPEIELFKHNPEKLKSELSEGWNECLEAYSFIDDKKLRIYHAQMLCDFKLQVSNVAMRGADLMSLLSSIECRSIFVRKPIVEFALNLPRFAKLDLENENPFLRTKHILKRVFLKYFPENLIVEKQGFSGFPNESQSLLGQKEKYLALELLGMDASVLSNSNFGRDLEWKLINIEHFLRSLEKGIKTTDV